MALIRKNFQLLFSKIPQNYPVFTSQQSKLLHTSEPSSSEIKETVKRPEGITKCTAIPGDGVGPEMMYCVTEVFKAAGVPIEFETFFFSEVHAGMSAPLDVVTKSIHRNGICLKGALATPDYSRTGELQTLNMKLRRTLDLYANVVHVKTLPGLNLRHDNIDCVIIREQTEGEYSALEHESVKDTRIKTRSQTQVEKDRQNLPENSSCSDVLLGYGSPEENMGVVECLKIVTARKSQRIAKFAFDYATKNNRKKVTAVHKANIMKLGDGLFLRKCQEMSKLYPKIKFESMIVDNCTMQMVSHPEQFDVMVMPNLYGSILDNLASGLVGGAGIVAGASYSPECVVFEPGARHTYSEAVGKNVANPTAMLLCGAKMLFHVNLAHYGEMIKRAIAKVLTDGKVKTKDVGGQSTTSEYTYAIINNLQAV